jgi:hypothetical protein
MEPETSESPPLALSWARLSQPIRSQPIFLKDLFYYYTPTND